MTNSPAHLTALTRPEELLHEGLVRGEDMPALRQVAEDFRIRITAQMRAAIAGQNDPVAAQFVPSPLELLARPEDMTDPIGDEVHQAAPGLTHRYPDRAILHVTKTCDVYCRFCFRRETVGETGPLPETELEQALDYIAATPALREIILTGGDPLTLSLRRLQTILERLSEITHVTTLRFHTRVPVVAPERITQALVALLRAQRPAVWVVVHCNHAQELTPAARGALARLVEGGVPLLSQSVLLRGVNNNPEALLSLFRSLQDCRVKPYYLHHCDLARGAGHFRTSIAEGRALMAALRGVLSGAAVPSYVLDIPGGFGKVPVTADHFSPGQRPGLWHVRDWQGRIHEYVDPEG